MAQRAKTVGLAFEPGEGDEGRAALGELESWGYSTLWLNGSQLQDLDAVRELLRATGSVQVATSVVAVDTFGWETVARLHAELTADHPGRFVLGLGGAHGPRPRSTLAEYLDRLDAATPPVPREERVLAALGPRMLELAAERTAGAVPVMVTPEHVAWSRERVGPDAWLVAQQFVVLDADAGRARDAARRIIGFLRDAEGGYSRHFRRMGFTDDDIDGLSDRLVDALVPWGELEDVRARVADHHAAGADEVALTVMPGPDTGVVEAWRRLAEAVIP